MEKLILKKTIRKSWVSHRRNKNMFFVTDRINKRAVRIKDNSIEYFDLTFEYFGNRAWYRLRGNTIYFNKYFLDWQNPSKEEIVLFELETGLMYIDYYLGLRTWSYKE